VECWAGVEAVKLADRTAGLGVLAEATTKAVVRYRTVDTRAVVTWLGDEYEIVGQDHDAARTQLTLYLKRRV
jgi:hypothetical protein